MDFGRWGSIKLLKLYSKYDVVLAGYERGLLWKKNGIPLLSGKKVRSLKNFLNNQRTAAHDYGLNLFLFKIQRERRKMLFHFIPGFFLMFE